MKIKIKPLSGNRNILIDVILIFVLCLIGSTIEKALAYEPLSRSEVYLDCLEVHFGDRFDYSTDEIQDIHSRCIAVINNINMGDINL